MNLCHYGKIVYTFISIIKKKVKKDEIETHYTPEGICILKWHNKRDIIMILSEYKPDLINLTIKDNKKIQNQRW